MHIGYWWESQKERDHWEDQDVGVYNIKMDLREIQWDGVDWMDMAQDKDQWRGRNSSPGRVKNFLFSRSSTPALRSTLPPIQWVPGALSTGDKAVGA
jgi:hypothetical protein